MSPKGKTPSLIGSSLGRPQRRTCGRRTPCRRCGRDIEKGQNCYDVPQPLKPRSTTRRFCTECFRNVLAQTKRDVKTLEEEAHEEPEEDARE